MASGLHIDRLDRSQANVGAERVDHVHQFFIGDFAQVPAADRARNASAPTGVSRHFARVLSQKICAVTLPFLAALNRKPATWALALVSPRSSSSR